MTHDQLVDIVRSEIKPSLGCTEPVAVGLAVSNTCARLDAPATELRLRLSSNIFKNAYSVRIPNTGKSGIPLAAALGCLLAAPDNTMEMFSRIDDGMVAKAEALAAGSFLRVEVIEDSRFFIEVRAANPAEWVRTITMDSHDNLILVERNGEVVLDRREPGAAGDGAGPDITACLVRELVEAAETVELAKIRFLENAIDMNGKASAEGLSGRYGLNVGKLFRAMYEESSGNDLVNAVKMVVAAACDCRMGGGPAPAMTVLGSGNQGFEATLPVATVARELGLGEEKTLRAVFMSILLTTCMKYQVGRLSPICGATLSGAAAAGAIAWLLGGAAGQVEGAIQNVFGNLSGMVCDGAKDGCALKLATCAGEAVIAAKLALAGTVVRETDGIIALRVEDSIRNFARLSREGMNKVDKKIIEIMLDKTSVPEPVGEIG